MARVLLNDRLDGVSINEAERILETTAATAMMVFNNGYVVTTMDNSSVKDTTLLQMTMQQPAISNHYPLELQVSDTTNASQESMVASYSVNIYTQCHH